MRKYRKETLTSIHVCTVQLLHILQAARARRIALPTPEHINDAVELLILRVQLIHLELAPHQLGVMQFKDALR